LLTTLNEQTCINTLTLRNIIRPFSQSRSLFEAAAPMDTIFADLAEQLEELKMYRLERGMILNEA